MTGHTCCDFPMDLPILRFDSFVKYHNDDMAVLVPDYHDCHITTTANSINIDNAR